MKSHTEHSFARILGRAPRTRLVTYKSFNEPGLLVEAFGSPELKRRKRSTLVFWNFARQDGRCGFTLSATLPKNREPENIPIRLAARVGAKAFREWAVGRLFAIENGDESPQFIHSGPFAIVRLG